MNNFFYAYLGIFCVYSPYVYLMCGIAFVNVIPVHLFYEDHYVDDYLLNTIFRKGKRTKKN